MGMPSVSQYISIAVIIFLSLTLISCDFLPSHTGSKVYEDGSEYIALCEKLGRRFVKVKSSLKCLLQGVKFLETASKHKDVYGNDDDIFKCLSRAHHEIGLAYAQMAFKNDSNLLELHKAHGHLLQALEYDESATKVQSEINTIRVHLGKWLLNEAKTVDQHLEAARWFEKVAQTGDSAAHKQLMDVHYEVGVHYEETERNFAKAFEHYSKGAEGGDGDAQYALAALYASGNLEGGADIPLAISWYEPAAELGVVDAQYALGMMYAQGAEGVQVNLTKAQKYLRLASLQGHKEAKENVVVAQRLLGLQSLNGDGDAGIGKNLKLAKMWLLRAAEANDSEALEALERMQSDAPVEVAAFPDHVLKKFNDAKRLLDAVASLPRIIARPDIKFGSLTGKDQKKVIAVQRLFKEAAKEGYPKAQLALARMHYDGKFAQKDVHEGWLLLQQALAAGDSDALAELGRMHWKGENAEKDPKAGMDYLTKAARKKSVRGMQYLGEMCARGVEGICEKDLLKAESWLQKSVAGGGGEDALKSLADVQDELGHAYEKAIGGMRKDWIEAEKWFLKAAKNGCASTLEFNNAGYVQYCLGNAFEKGSDGYPQDSFAALEWYQKAKDNGEDVDICLKFTLLRLTDIYLKGYDGFPPDPTRAVECCRRALLLGESDPRVKLELGVTLLKLGRYYTSEGGEDIDREVFRTAHADVVEGLAILDELTHNDEYRRYAQKMRDHGIEIRGFIEESLGHSCALSSQPREAVVWLELAQKSGQDVDQLLGEMLANPLLGELVELIDLVDTPEFEGALGYIAGKKDAEGCYLVEVDALEDSEDNTKVNIRAGESNIRMLPPTVDDEAEAKSDNKEEAGKDEDDEDDVIFCDDEGNANVAPETPVSEGKQEKKSASKSSGSGTGRSWRGSLGKSRPW